MAITKAYVKDQDRPYIGPIYVPGENYAWYLNFDKPISDPNFATFVLQIWDVYGNVIVTPVGTLSKDIVYHTSPTDGLYNIYCNFNMPACPSGQYYFVIYDTAGAVMKCKSNTIIVENNLSYITKVTSYLAYRNSLNKYGFAFENIPDFYNRFRLPLSQTDLQFESDRTQYRNETDKQYRNIKTYRDKVIRIQSMRFTDTQHEAITAVYEMDMIFLNTVQLIAKTAYTIDANLNSMLTDGSNDMYEVINETPFWPSESGGSGGGIDPGPGGGGGVTPIVSAGPDQDLAGGTNSASLTGTATPATGRTIVSVRWVVIDYPTGFPIPTFSSPTAYSTTVTGLHSGTFNIQFQAIDDQGNIGVDQMTIVVEVSNAIIVNAGVDQRLDEGVNTTNLYGTVTTSGGAVLDRVEWVAVSINPTGSGWTVGDISFSTPDNLNTAVSGLPMATTVNRTATLRLRAYDTDGNMFSDDIVITMLKPSVMILTDGWDSARPTQKVYVYTPQGYDPAQVGGFPALIFLHGTGANGDQVTPQDDPTILLDPESALPYHLYNKHFPMKRVVVMAQLHTGVWDVIQATKVVNWAISHYNIDPNNFACTGYSSGGAGTFDIIAANPTLFCAGIACSPIASDVGAGNGGAIKDVAILASGSYNDLTGAPPDAPARLFDAIDSVTGATPRGIYPLRCIMSYYAPHTYQAWGYDIYDKRRASLDFEADFLDLHPNNKVTTATNYVVRAETRQTFFDLSKALVVVSSLPAGSSRTALQTRLDTLHTAITTGKSAQYVMVQLGKLGSGTVYYTQNNMSGLTPNTQFPLYNTKGVSTTLGFQLITTLSAYTVGMTSNQMGMPASDFSQGYAIVGPTTFKITGVDSAKRYDLFFYCSDRNKSLNPADQRSGVTINVNGYWGQTREEGWNTDFTVNVYNVAPVSSALTITVDTLYGYMGCVMSVLVRERPDNRDRANMGRYNMAKTAMIGSEDFGTMIGDPATAVRTAADPVSGWVISTNGTAPPYWQDYAGFYADDDLSNGNTITPPPFIPLVVQKSGRFLDNLYWDNDNEYYNIILKGTPGMGFRAGFYQVRISGTSYNPQGSTTEFVVKTGKGGIQRQLLEVQGNPNEYRVFTGEVREGEEIQIWFGMPGYYGQAFINWVEVEKVDAI